MQIYLIFFLESHYFLDIQYHGTGAFYISNIKPYFIRSINVLYACRTLHNTALLLCPCWSDHHKTGRKHLFILGFSQPSHPENYENLAQLGINKPLAGPYSWCNSALIFGFTHRYINKKQIVPTKFVTNTIQLSNYLNV